MDLKAELFKRKEQFKREGGGKSSTFSSKPVSEKVNNIITMHDLFNSLSIYRQHPFGLSKSPVVKLLKASLILKIPKLLH